MKLSVINKLYEGQMHPKCAPSMRTQEAQLPPQLWDTPKSDLGENVVLFEKGALVCLVGAHTVPRSGG